VSRGDARAVLDATEERLRTVGCETPRVDAEFLVAHVLGSTRSGVRADGSRTLSADELESLERLVARREAREPLAYVLGEWGFRRLTLKVDRRVLVPRPETETVVERCVALLAGRREPRVLDVGTGSGAIALAIADEHAGSRVLGIDVSDDALALARENAERSGLSVELEPADLFLGLPAGPWELVVSNPPYVSADELPALSSEVRDWEPRIAVEGEGATEAIAQRAREVLVSDGALVLEVADGDAARVAALLADRGYGGVRVTRDLGGRDRVVEGTLA
jgi:release factor glutamine methyltransferase